MLCTAFCGFVLDSVFNPQFKVIKGWIPFYSSDEGICEEPSVRVPKDARGRFITGDGTVFQAYWMDERKQ